MAVIAALVSQIYNTFFGPLFHLSGPKLRAFSIIPKLITIITGRKHTDAIALHAKYGPIVRIAPTELSFAGGAQARKDILGFKKAGQPGFPKDVLFYTGEGAMFGRKNVMLSNANDAQHAKLRRVISHAFSDRSVRDVEPMLLHWTRKFHEKLGGFAREGSAVDVVKYSNCTTFDIMGDLAFNEDLGMLDQGDENEWVKSIFQGIKAGTFIRAVRNSSAAGWFLVYNILMKLPAAGAGMRKTIGFSSERILAKGVGDMHLDQAEHEGLAFFFMVADTEKTASALSGILYSLLTHPTYLAELQRELRSTFPTFDDISLDALTRLRYTNAVIQEGLRVCPLVPSVLPGQSPPGGAMADGRFIPGGVTCGVHHMSTYRSPLHFTDPNAFRPERWLGDPKYKDDHLSAVEPFHVGPRNCVGKNLAWHELRLLLVTTVLSYDFDLAPECRDWLDRGRCYTIWEKPALMCRVRKAAVSA